MLVTIKLFAVARQRVERDSIQVEVREGATVRELREAVGGQYPPLAELLPHVRFAVNSDYAADAQVIPAGAEVACIPPVSGG